MTDDLYVTGNHIIPMFKKYNNMTIKYKTAARLNPKFKLVQEDKLFTVYNLVLQSEDPNETFSIFANGLLCETMSICDYNKLKSPTTSDSKHFIKI